MSAYATADRAYKESAILTAPPEKLVVMLYDGARRFLFQAAAAMRQGELATANARLQRAEAILDELLATLDMSAGQVAVSLQSLYLFCRRTLTDARFSRSADSIDEVSGLLGELRDAWAQVGAAA